jgi:hypothetical protein
METAEVEETIRSLYLDEGGLRDEDRKKAREVGALLEDLMRVVRRRDRRIVELCAGHAYVSLVGARLAGFSNLWLVEREPARAERCRRIAAKLPGATVEVRTGEVADLSLWPEEVDVVVALHACGAASDEVIDATIAAKARRLFLVPCCYTRELPAARRAAERADAMRLPSAAPIRTPFIESLVDSERVLRLEAAGYEVELVPFVPKSVTPHNLLFRARRVNEPNKMQRAASELALLAGSGHTNRT